MARPRTPTNVLQLRGAFAKNPNRARPDEPKPAGKIGQPPKYFDDDHRKVWKEIERSAAPGVLTISDRLAMEILCVLVVEFRSDPQGMACAKIARMEAIIGKFGFTPADRSKVCAPTKKPGNAFSDF